MRALVLGAPCKCTARLLWSWLESGNTVEEFWSPSRIRERLWQHDRLDGRIRPGWSVSAALRRHGIAHRAVGPLSRDASVAGRIRSLAADVLLCAFFTHIVPEEILDRFGRRAVNFHPSVLPMYRGPVPRLKMILNEDVDRYGGVTLHVMSPGVDAGDIIASRRVPWPEGGAFDRWDLEEARAVGSMVRGELHRFLAGEIGASPQTGPSSYYRSVDRSELLLDARLPAGRMRDRVERLAERVHLRVEGPRGELRIFRFLGTLGPPTGEPPDRSRGRVALDAADRRVLLQPWGRWAKKSLWLRHCMLIARHSSGESEGIGPNA